MHSPTEPGRIEELFIFIRESEAAVLTGARKILSLHHRKLKNKVAEVPSKTTSSGDQIKVDPQRKPAIPRLAKTTNCRNGHLPRMKHMIFQIRSEKRGSDNRTKEAVQGLGS
jgi:hypothetical protein